MGTKVKANDLSEFQENNFDLNFVISKETPANDIYMTISKANKDLITKVELIDIYENEDTLKGKRSITYKVYIQSMDKTLDDKVKADLIDLIIKKVEKK
jgi:phenylalanyl-tRNA synthetase beta chain